MVLCVCAPLAAPAGELYVSPTPPADGDGTRTRPLGLQTALGPASPAKPGDVVYLLGGRYEVPVDPRRRAPVPLRLEASGTKDRPIRVRPAPGASVHINGPVFITGRYAEYIGLEIGSADWRPDGGVRGNDFAVRVGASQGIRLINCNIFGQPGGGISDDVQAEDLEVYGCLVHDFGRLQMQRVPMDIGDIQTVAGGTGQGLLSANRTGTKTLTHNVFYRGCGGNMQLSTYTVGYDFIENISVLSKAYKTNENMDSFPLCSNYQRGAAVPMDRIRMIGNVAYQPLDISAWRPNARLISYRPGVRNASAEFRGNYLIGAARGLDLTHWRKIEVTGNTIWATRAMFSINVGRGEKARRELKGFTFADNTYIDNGNEAPFLCPAASEVRGGLTFAQWQAAGMDKGSRLVKGKNGRPAGTKVFVFPNRHEKGRAHVAAFHWERQGHVQVDLTAVVGKGKPYRIYNLLDVTHTIAQAKPVVTGTGDGAAVRLPLRSDPTSPNCDVFLVLSGKP